MELNNLVEGLIYQLDMAYQQLLGDQLAEKITYYYNLTEEKVDRKFKFYGIGFSHSTKRSFNFMIYHHVPLVNSELSNLHGFITGITAKNKDIWPGKLQWGTIFNHPIPSGFVVSPEKLLYIKTKSDEIKSTVNPVGELVKKDKKLLEMLGELPSKVQYNGLQYTTPKLFTVYPFQYETAAVTVAAVSCAMAIQGWEKYRILPKKNKVNVAKPRMSRVSQSLEILKRIKQYVTQFDFTPPKLVIIPKLELPTLIAMNLEKQLDQWHTLQAPDAPEN